MAAYKEAFVKEALSGLRGVYSSKLSLIPVKEMVDTVTVVKQTKIAKEGGWAKVKRGKYKGDIGRVASLCRLPLPPLFAASRCRRPVARPLSASLCRISYISVTYHCAAFERLSLPDFVPASAFA